ncbi:MAG: hypothetical protein AAGL69_10760 [Pseudomonadota bacterium]
MNDQTESFRFISIRSPQDDGLTATRPVMPMPSNEQISGEAKPELAQGKVQALAGTLDRQLSNVDASDSDRIQSVLNDNGIKQDAAIAALIRFGKDSSTVNKVVSSISHGGASLPFDPDNPLLLKPRGEEVAEILNDQLLSKRRSFFGPVGVGDLMIVEQALSGYEFGEIAHIENVLSGEKRERRHLVRVEFDEFSQATEEQQQLSEKSLQTTERFALKNSVKSEIQREQEQSVNIRVNTEYPPYVEVDSEFDYSKSDSKKRSAEKSSEFARDVTEKAVEKTEERVEVIRSQRKNTQTEESNLHSFEAGANNVVGVYRHVDKRYRMRLIRKRPRLFYEIFVPSPGVFLRKLDKEGVPENPRLAQLRQRLEEETLDLTLEQVTRGNYGELVRRFGLTGMEPPPKERSDVDPVFLTKSVLDRDTSSRGAQSFEVSDGVFEVPDGYRAVSGKIGVVYMKVTDSNKSDLIAELGSKTFEVRITSATELDENRTWRGESEFDMFESRTQQISYAARGRHDNFFVVTFEVKCEIIDDGFESWRAKMYSAIIAAHDAQLQELKSEIRELESQQRVKEDEQPRTLPPAMLREIEEKEIKKFCLRIFGQEARAASDVTLGNTPLAMDLNEVDSLVFGDGLITTGDHRVSIEAISTNTLNRFATEVRFGEQAFEWHNMQYTLYPYFWNELKDWKALVELNHDDERHQEFLRAGYARVLLPVRENWESTVHDFLVSGVTALNKTEQVSITDPLWLPLYQELREKQSASSEDYEVVDAWDAVVPTNLVMLDDGEHVPPQGNIPEGWDEVGRRPLE